MAPIARPNQICLIFTGVLAGYRGAAGSDVLEFAVSIRQNKRMSQYSGRVASKGIRHWRTKVPAHIEGVMIALGRQHRFFTTLTLRGLFLLEQIAVSDELLANSATAEVTMTRGRRITVWGFFFLNLTVPSQLLLPT